jgi:STE24 endopeptidase
MLKKFFCFFVLLTFGYMSSLSSQGQSQVAPDSVKVQPFNVESAVNGYLSSLTAEQKARSDSYFEGGYWIILWDFLAGVFVAWIFLSLGLSGWIRKLAFRAKKRNIQNLIYILLYFFFSTLIVFPFTVYTGFIREHHYGLSNLSFGGWLSEEMISMALSLVFMGLLVMLIYILMRKIVKTWWIWGSGVFIIFAVIVLFIGPVFISPLFNKYKPLEDGPVNNAILSLARANGVPVNNVYQFDASRQSSRISANVSGIGSTIRVSLNDNLLNKCTVPEIKSVMAHELGHYVLNHVYKLLVYISIVIIVGFVFVNWLMKKLIAAFGSRWGISDLSDITSLPLFVVVFSLYIFLATPVLNNISRTSESEADIFGLNAAREPDGFASVSMKLSEYRKIDPNPLEEFIFYDHPSGRARVTMAMKWKAENLSTQKP